MERLQMYVSYLTGSFILFLILNFFAGEYILLSFSQIWNNGHLSWYGLGTVWFIFAWALVVTCVLELRESRSYFDPTPGEILAEGSWASLNAGVFEELIFRWLIFFNAMVLVPLANFVFGGFLGFNAVQWIYTNALVPLANIVTFHALEPQLLNPNWIFGAAIVSACAKFREEHEHLGYLGYVNSWFMGMVFFYLTFNYGLLTAMAAHFLYDLLIFVVSAMLAFRRPQPNSIFA